MKYQNDAHHYREVVRKRRRLQSAKGISLIVVSLALMFYAVPGFAVSVFDYGAPETTSSTSFAGEISDVAPAATANAAAATADAGASVSAAGADNAAGAVALEGTDATKLSPDYAISDYSIISNTTGPGALSNEAAVSAAKMRSQALAAAEGKNGKDVASSSGALKLFAGSAESSAEQTAVYVNPIDIAFAVIALIAGVICATLGIRMIVRARQMRGMQITAAYSNALRA